MNIDIVRLRNDLKEYLMGAYFNLDVNIIMGYLINIDNMTNEEILDLCINLGFDISCYEIYTR